MFFLPMLLAIIVSCNGRRYKTSRLLNHEFAGRSAFGCMGCKGIAAFFSKLQL